MNDEDFMKSIGWASEEEAREAREANAPAPFDYASAPSPFGQQQQQGDASGQDHAFAPRSSRNTSSSSGGRNQPQQRPSQGAQQAPFDPHANLSTLSPRTRVCVRTTALTNKRYRQRQRTARRRWRPGRTVPAQGPKQDADLWRRPRRREPRPVAPKIIVMTMIKLFTTTHFTNTTRTLNR
jgi:hypothetical protein